MQIDNKNLFIRSMLISALCLFFFLPLYSQTKPHDPNLLLQKANSLKIEGEYKEAEIVYRQALVFDRKSVEAMLGLGQTAFLKQEWGKIKDWYGKVLEVQPFDSEANYYLGIAYRETGKTKSFQLKKMDFNKSRDFFSLVVDREPAYRDVFYQRGLVERWDEKFEKCSYVGS